MCILKKSQHNGVIRKIYKNHNYYFIKMAKTQFVIPRCCRLFFKLNKLSKPRFLTFILSKQTKLQGQC